MIIFPRPRVPYLAALALAIPTYGVSFPIFYFAFKRPYDSRATSLILARSKNSLESGDRASLSNVNRAAIERVFVKFGIPELEHRYPSNIPFVRWGVLRHPMLNDGQPFTLRVIRNDGEIVVQAAKGEAWWLLQNPQEDVLAGSTATTHEMRSPEHFWALIKILAKIGKPIERQNFKLDAIADLVQMNENCIDEVFDNFRGFRFWRRIDSIQYYVIVRTIDPSQEWDSGVSIEVTIEK